MKRAFYILIVGLLLVLCSYSLTESSDDTSRDINQAICLGQYDRIAEYLAPEVMLGVQGVENSCPKEQVEQALKEFFKRNKPQQFLCTSGSSFVTGQLITSFGRSYKVDYTLKTIDNKEFITNFHVY